MPALTTDMEQLPSDNSVELQDGLGTNDYLVFGAGEREVIVTKMLSRLVGETTLIGVVRDISDVPTVEPETPLATKAVIILPLMHKLVRGQIELVGTPVSKIRKVIGNTSVIVDHGDEPDFFRSILPSHKLWSAL